MSCLRKDRWLCGGTEMPIDYEKEYDNRARVPEHPEIFARWEAETKAYRAAAAWRATGHFLRALQAPDHRHVPGQGRGQRRAARAVHPWRLVALARSCHVQPACQGPERPRRRRRGRRLRSRARTVPIATIIEQMRAAVLFLWRKHKKRIFVYGHSAGGHLDRLHGGDRLEDARSRARRPIWCRPAIRFPAYSIWRR